MFASFTRPHNATKGLPALARTSPPSPGINGTVD